MGGPHRCGRVGPGSGEAVARLAERLALAERQHLAGGTPNTRAVATAPVSPTSGPPGSRNAPSTTSNGQSSFAFHMSARRRSLFSSVTCSARPSTTMSRPERNRSPPVVSTTCGLPSRFRAFCSSAPVQKCSSPSSHIAGRGATCGRPSWRTVDSQKISARSIASTTSGHGRGVAPGLLKRSSSSAVGDVTVIAASLGRGPDECIDPRPGRNSSPEGARCLAPHAVSVAPSR